MVYNIIVSPQAQKEIEDVIDFYSIHRLKAPSKFVEQLNQAYHTLIHSPLLKIR